MVAAPVTPEPKAEQEPLPAPRPLPSVPPPTPVTGGTPQPSSTQTLTVERQFVVLKDEKLIEGQVTQNGEKVIVRQGALDRPFAKADVLFVGKSKDDVYRYMMGKASATDPVARLKVAKWCMFHGMRSQALTEAREVVRLDAKNASALQMVRTLEESLEKFPEAGTAPSPKSGPTANPNGPTLPGVPPPPMGKEPPPIPPAIPPAAVAEPDLDVSPEAAAVFTAHIQPILGNLCAECHAKANHTSRFKLARGTDHLSGIESARPNLIAAAAQLNRTEPAKSPLLVKALAAHGGMKESAFTARSMAAYRNLEVWAYAAIGTPTPPPAKPNVVVKAESVVPAASTTSVATSPWPEVPTTSTSSSSFGQEAPPLPPPGPSPTNKGEPVDEFDPSIFNRGAF